MKNRKRSILLTASCGAIFTSLLTTTFVVLKLFHIISWGWCWVVAPTWIPLAYGLKAGD